MKKILITGAGGYIGSVSTYLMLQKGYEVVAIDNFTTGFRGPLDTLQEKFGKEKLRYYELNLAGDVGSILKQEPGIEAVLHYAASCSVNESMEKPEKYFVNNVGATNNLLVSLMENGINKIVFSSTCAVYGEAQYVPIDEQHPRKPANPYGESKKTVETFLQWYGTQKGLNHVILRYFNVCGASDDSLIGDAKKPSVHLMQNAVRGALGLEKFMLTCPKVDTPDGTTIRDYVNVVDLNEAHALALDYLLKGGKSETINLGTGKGDSVKEIVNTVQRITGAKFDLVEGPTRKGEYPTMIASIEKAQKILGWAPKRTLEDSVNSLVAWYKARPHGWDK